MGGYKHSQLKGKSYEEIQGLYERQQKGIQDFTSALTLDIHNPRPRTYTTASNEEAAADYEQDKLELRMWLAVVLDKDETMDPENLSVKYPIIDWESQNLGSVDMEDIHIRLNGFAQIGDEKDWTLISWKLYENYGVHSLLMDGTLTCFNMLVEKRYPLIKEMLKKMLNWKLEAEAESTMAFEILKFIKSQFRRGLLGIMDFYNLVLLIQLDTAGDVYVDDIIFGLTKKELCNVFEKLMHEKFQMSSMGELTFFLGLQVQQKKDGIFISQDKFVAEILKKFRFTEVKTASTPMETQKPLLKNEDGEEVHVHMYRSMIGSLMYLTSSRPDIMFVVCACARYQVNPKVSHLHAVKKIFRYLKGQPKLGLWYPKDSPFDLVAYTDSDYARASLDRKSTTGGCQFLRCRLISWQCKKQTVVANSTTEAEYVAASSCCGQVLWIQNQLLDYGNETNIMHQLPMYPRRGKKSLTVPRQRRPNNSVTMTYEESQAKLKQQIVDTETLSSSNES
ncbi:uncharacterized mitochondrial protein-like protein [Tanacetum coccineum]